MTKVTLCDRCGEPLDKLKLSTQAEVQKAMAENIDNSLRGNPYKRDDLFDDFEKFKIGTEEYIDRELNPDLCKKCLPGYKKLIEKSNTEIKQYLKKE